MLTPEPCCLQVPGSGGPWTPPLCARSRSSLGLTTSSHSCPGHSEPPLGRRGELVLLWTCRASVGTHGQCLVRDVTFLDRAVVEAPGDTSGVCAEAALPTCALLGCDARVAAVHSDPRVGRTDFLNCRKQKGRKEEGCVTSCSTYLGAGFTNGRQVWPVSEHNNHSDLLHSDFRRQYHPSPCHTC